MRCNSEYSQDSYFCPSCRNPQREKFPLILEKRDLLHEKGNQKPSYAFSSSSGCTNDSDNRLETQSPRPPSFPSSTRLSSYPPPHPYQTSSVSPTPTLRIPSSLAVSPHYFCYLFSRDSLSFARAIVTLTKKKRRSFCAKTMRTWWSCCGKAGSHDP